MIVISVVRSWRFRVFAASFLFGAMLYCLAAHSGSRGEALAISGSPEPEKSLPREGDMERSLLDAEFKVFSYAEHPVDLDFDEDGNFFLLDRDGSIIKGNQEKANPGHYYLKIADASFLKSAGCTALALHPDFLVPQAPGFGKFFLALAEQPFSGPALEPTATEQHQEVIYEYTAIDPHAAHFEGLRREVLRISNPQTSQTGLITDLAFDADGCLFIGVADLDGESHTQASNLKSIYGKVLRIDPSPSAEAGCSIPDDNPFSLTDDCRPEIWAYGLRLPRQITHDPLSGWTCICDFGKDSREAIRLSKNGAEFFGSNLSESPGRDPMGSFPGENAPQESSLAENDQSAKNAAKIVGSCIYRGESFPFLEGKMLFADQQGQVMAAELTPEATLGKTSILQIIGEERFPVQRLLQSPSGEVFVFGTDGKVFELKRPSRVTGKEGKERSPYRVMLVSAH